MSEEVRNAPVNVPRAIVTNAVVNGALGFGMTLAVVFSIGSIDDALVFNTIHLA